VRAVAAAEVARRALELAEIVATLAVDDEVVLAALALPLLDSGALDEKTALPRFGRDAVRLARELTNIGHFGLPAQWNPALRLSDAQAETLRKMLLAVVTDPRLIVLRLAEQLHALRNAKLLSADEQRRLALETREIYAPLANRLGVWQLKWELEDFALRYLQPDDYRVIAASLKQRRAERERSLEEIRRRLSDELAKAGVTAEVAARPKHIHSIWRKMQRKQLAFEQVLDVRALRVIVNTISECYAALGVVHGLWPYLPGEFDDYIATPKGNDYRSLHTAVTADAQPLEVQIRTREMHEHAELGVAAHWKYKEGGRRDAAYESKIHRIRQLLEPTPGGDGNEDVDFLERMRADIFVDRVYALSPRGEVIDLPKGATPIDFAYHLHTDLGHRCRGARVNGRMVALNYQLKTGEVVEIVTGREVQPSRDWLREENGFLASSRSRAKVRSFFRKKEEEEAARAQRASAPEAETPVPEVAEVSVETVVAERPVRTGSSSGVVLGGVGDVLSNFARCCRPVPPEPIVGYITQGRGVRVHKQTCASLQRMKLRQPERIVNVEWGVKAGQLFPVEIAVHAFDRRGLVRDISAVLADEQISIQQMTTTTNARENTAQVALRVGVHGLDEVTRLLSRIGSLPNVVRARRTI